MSERNISIEEEDLMLYVDVQPLYIDELENSKNSAAQSAQSAAQSAQSAQNWLDNIISYKSNLELFYAQAMNSLNVGLNDALTTITNAKNASLGSIQALLNNINSAAQQALSNIQTTAQQILNQIMDYAEEIEETVDGAVSEDYLIQSNALESGEVSTKRNVYNQINSYAHSTFDASKFTKVGSPIVTSDGIMTYTHHNQKVRTGIILDGSKSWKIKVKYKNLKTSTGTNPAIIGLNGGGDYDNQIKIDSMTSSTYQICFVQSGTAFGYSSPLQHNKEYLLEFVYEPSSGYYIYVDGVLRGNSGRKTAYNCTNAITFGGVDYQQPNAQIDLKYVYIEQDGVPVFSGNKTGINAIKADDYTIVPASDSTVLVTDDGVASGFSSSDYITKSLSLSSGKILICGSAQPNYNNGYNKALALYCQKTGGNHVFVRTVYDSTGLHFLVIDGNTSSSITTNLTNYSGGKIYYEIDTKARKIRCKEGQASSWTTSDITDTTVGNNIVSNLEGGLNKIQISGALSGHTDYLFDGSIDLNALKIYVNDDLVYQPCLKIPYTESKTGSKVVNAIYRDRVNDMANQFGYAPYYTLDEGNGNFTLPKGEIYGMIEKLRELIIQRTS